MVVFDGYTPSTKDAVHMRRLGKTSSLVEISDSNMYISDQSKFFANYSNKEQFILNLSAKLESSGAYTIICQSDADTTIDKNAPE